MKIIGFVLIFCLSLHANAQSSHRPYKSCYCEVGNWPANQKDLFIIGCQIWLNRQVDCNVKEIVNEDTNYLLTKMPSTTSTLSVGYVGHWDSSKHFVDYLAASILPVMRKKNISAQIDNTACDAMHDPEEVFAYLKTLNIPKSISLTAKGNQAISVSTWDVILPSSDNFTALVSTNVDHIIFPPCRNYLHHSCLRGIQTHETGRCLDESNQLDKLVCCGVRGDGRNSSKDLVYEQWEHAKDCLN